MQEKVGNFAGVHRPKQRRNGAPPPRKLTEPTYSCASLLAVPRLHETKKMWRVSFSGAPQSWALRADGFCLVQPILARILTLSHGSWCWNRRGWTSGAGCTGEVGITRGGSAMPDGREQYGGIRNSPYNTPTRRRRGRWVCVCHQASCSGAGHSAGCGASGR